VGGGPGVPGVVEKQTSGRLDALVRVPVTGMQAQLIENGIINGMMNPPNYDLNGGSSTCDCVSWAQQVLGDAGVNTGPLTFDPHTLTQQLQQIYPQQ
jgi:hypothetical protein